MATTTSTFTLYKSLIMETVKNETHISAHVARAMDKNASELAFQEEAGDEEYHERKLERTLYSSLDKIKAEIIGYLNTESDGSNNLTCTVDTEEITFTMVLSSRFNTSYLTPLADLISKFVEDTMLFDWWTPINQNNAKIYSEKAELDRQSVLKCFIKNAPSKSSYNYGDVTGDSGTGAAKTISIASSKTMSVGEQTIPIDVSGIGSGSISATSSDTSVVSIVEGGVLSTGIKVKALKAGSAKITVYLTTDVSISSICRVTVQ